MESVTDFLCAFFMTIFWIFRIVVTAITYLQIDISFPSINWQLECALLFLTLLCIICVYKRFVLGGIIYAIAYGVYFGPDLYTNLSNGVTIDSSTNILIDFVAIVLACMVLLNIIVSKIMKVSHKQNGEWFYKDEKFDRQLDERADKNNYRIY